MCAEHLHGCFSFGAHWLNKHSSSPGNCGLPTLPAIRQEQTMSRRDVIFMLSSRCGWRVPLDITCHFWEAEEAGPPSPRGWWGKAKSTHWWLSFCHPVASWLWHPELMYSVLIWLSKLTSGKQHSYCSSSTHILTFDHVYMKHWLLEYLFPFQMKKQAK